MKDCTAILDGEFEILRVTPDLYDDTEEILARISLDQEFGCLATRLKESPLAVSEFRILIRHILTLGISFAIRHVESGRIVAAIACLVYNPSRESSYDNLEKKFRSPSMLNYIRLFDAIDESFDLYMDINSWMEVEYLVTLPEFRCRGLAYYLCRHTMDFGKLMAHGKLPPEVFHQLPVEMQIERPEAVSTFATSFYSQKCGIKVGMQVAQRWHISDLQSLGVNIIDTIEGLEYAELQIMSL
ncbi:uncharacterized protein Dana_GF17654, isoform B [Drosophila ananassae]|uniref:Uncharacterized protein, isoform B n=2 Tax=Drosophila ananassae TaxID=7217 RepID=B3LYD4_DROAN|nr:uncharacterized protein Dana_GF17654, isoform B [Drosophila ananassae]